MQIKLKKLFRFQVGNETKTLEPGTYKVPTDISEYVAELAVRWGRAERIPAKAAKPAAKKTTKQKGNAPENKTRMGK